MTLPAPPANPYLSLSLLYAFRDSSPDIPLVLPQGVSSLTLANGPDPIFRALQAILRGESLHVSNHRIPVLPQPIYRIHRSALTQSCLDVIGIELEMLRFLQKNHPEKPPLSSASKTYSQQLDDLQSLSFHRIMATEIVEVVSSPLRTIVLRKIQKASHYEHNQKHFFKKNTY